MDFMKPKDELQWKLKLSLEGRKCGQAYAELEAEAFHSLAFACAQQIGKGRRDAWDFSFRLNASCVQGGINELIKELRPEKPILNMSFI